MMMRRKKRKKEIQIETEKQGNAKKGEKIINK